MRIDVLEKELDSKRQEGLALLESTSKKAESENRVFTDEERSAIEKVRDEGQAIQGRIARAKGDSAMVEEINRLSSGNVLGMATKTTTQPPRSMGEQFVSSEAFEFFRKGGHRTSAQWRSPSVELFHHGGAFGPFTQRAATLTEDPASGGSLVLPDYQAGILSLPFKPLVVGDLFAPGTTDSNLISYMREKTFVNAAATVLEGGVKPESTLTFEPAQDPVRKIAHWLPVSEEMLEDAPQIRSYIDARLRLGVELEEEDQLLNGTGVEPDILGLLLRPGLAADVAAGVDESNADAILRQIMAIFGSSFLMPDGIVLNPADWTNVLLTKTTGGEYITPGPFSAIQTPTLWGLRVAITPSVVAKTSIVGAFRTGGQVFRKGGVRVEASNSHVDFFIKNLVAIRAEERLALAVYRPGAFGKVTGLSS